MGFRIEINSNYKDDNKNFLEETQVYSYSYDDYTKVVNPDDKSEDIYFKSILIYTFTQFDDSYSKTYYTPNGEYNDLVNTSLKKRVVSFTNKDNAESENKNMLVYYSYIETYENNPTIMNGIKLNKAYKKYLAHSKSITIIEDDKPVLDFKDTKVKEFYKLEQMCKTLSFILPYQAAKDQIENAVEEITTYLVTGKMNKEILYSCIDNLKNCEFCSSSLELLENTLTNPNIDFRETLEKLNTYIHNLEEIIQLNTKNSTLEENLSIER